jgi:hypothetical protein
VKWRVDGTATFNTAAMFDDDERAELKEINVAIHVAKRKANP